MKKLIVLLSVLCLFSCTGKEDEKQIPAIGFVDAFEDNTLSQAKDGFLKALADSGFSEEKKTLTLHYRNAQGNLPALSQTVQYFIGKRVCAIATCPSLSTIAALQATTDIPVFMTVSPEPSLMKLGTERKGTPSNLFGVGEGLDYIDTSFALIKSMIKPAGAQLRVGMIYNQSEPQSMEALSRIQQLAKRLNVELMALPVAGSNDVQLVAQSLTGMGIDAFFANPDNTVFAAFETIVRTCDASKVPVFTSEAGLVKRGAVAAYGADIFQWGYQSGAQCARFLKQGNINGLKWEMVRTRQAIYNPKAAARFGLTFPSSFKAL